MPKNADGCEPLSGVVSGIAKKLGGELLLNEDGVYVLHIHGGEFFYPNEAAAADHLTRMIRTTSDHAEATTTIKSAVAAVEKRTGVTDKETREALDEAAKVPVGNVLEMMTEARKLSSEPGEPLNLDGGEQAPFFSRPHKGIGQSFKGEGIGSTWFTRNHAQLMQHGPVGRWLANAATQYDISRETLANHLHDGMAKGLEVLDKLTTMAAIKDGSAPPEALHMWYNVVQPYIASVKESAEFLGITDEIVPEDGIPTSVGARAEDIPDEMLKSAKQQGIAQSKDELAGIFADQSFEQVRRTLERNGVPHKDQQARIKWLKEQSTGLAGHLNHVHVGEEGRALTSVKQTMTAFNRIAARRLADAAHFGPYGENIEMAKDMLSKDNAFKHHTEMVDAIMDKIRGRVYIPSTRGKEMWNDATRFLLSESGSRHLAQTRIAMMQHGANAVGFYLKDMADDLARGDPNELHRWGVDLRHTSWEIGQFPDDAFEPRTEAETKNFVDWLKREKLPGVLHAGANFSTLGIHTVLNFGRKLAGRMARGGFDSYWDKAMKGDRNTLGLFADVFGIGNSTTAKGREAFVEQLRGMNKSMAKMRFVKRMSDLEGMTFNPKDYPGIANSDMGKRLVKFRVFKWNLHHNIWNQMTSPNYSKAYRMKVAMRYIATTPISAVDPILRHINPASKGNLAKAAIVGASMFGVGAANIDSESAYNAMEKGLKDKTTSSMIYGLMAFATNDGSLGIAGDIAQSINQGNFRDIGNAFVSRNLVDLAPALNLVSAGLTSAHAVLNHNSKEQKRALSELMQDVPLGNTLARATGVRAPTRLRKKPFIEDVVQKGAKAVGLH
jgi:hypothetical protein